MIQEHKVNSENEHLITLDELKTITRAMARQNALWSECDLKVNQADRKLLNECLKEPMKKAKGFSIYEGAKEQASALFYMLLKNKPFAKHNDRIALVVLGYVMDRHAAPMKLDEAKLFDYIRWMRLSPEGTKEEVIKAFSRVLEQ